MEQPKHIVIIGAGISGLISAYYLLKAGHRVEIIESEEAVASKASGANAAQLSYTYVNPMGSPGLWRILPAILMGRMPGFKLRRTDWPTMRWGLKLLSQSSAARFADNRSKLLDLSLESRRLFEELKQDTSIAFKHYSKGKIQLFNSEAAVASAKHFAKELAKFDIEQQWQSDEECQVRLAGFNIGDETLGGIYSAID